MPRPRLMREATTTPGVRKVTRLYDSGRKAVTYEVRLRAKDSGPLVQVGTYTSRRQADSICAAVRKARDANTDEAQLLALFTRIANLGRR